MKLFLPRRIPAAFTLIELLVVITILAILAGLTFPILSAVKEYQRKVQAKSDIMAITTAAESFYSEYGQYPVDYSMSTTDVICGADNNKVIDVLRNVKDGVIGNPLNARGVPYLNPSVASNQAMPMGGLQTSTGVWFDPWGSPYHIALDGDGDKQLNSQTPIPNFYTDVGPLQGGIIVWSYGKNGELGGGPAVKPPFAKENGAPGKLNGSGDVTSWHIP